MLQSCSWTSDKALVWRHLTTAEVVTMKNRVQAVQLILGFQYVPKLPCTRVSLTLLNKVIFLKFILLTSYHSVRRVGAVQDGRSARFGSH